MLHDETYKKTVQQLFNKITSLYVDFDIEITKDNKKILCLKSPNGKYDKLAIVRPIARS